MRISPEIKDFTKNTLIFTLFFTLVIHLSWGYIRPYLMMGAEADNDMNFKPADITYIGNIATALSLKLGGGDRSNNTSGAIEMDVNMPISEILADSKKGEKYLIENNMRLISGYVEILRTDIRGLLDDTDDRTTTLDEHIDVLKSYYISASERSIVLSEQSTELKTLLIDATARVETTKIQMEEKYKAFDTTDIHSVIDEYVRAKNDESQAKVYLAYVERFQKGYTILQGENKKILDTLINNREALIQKAIIVIPDTGSDLLKKMNVIMTEEEYKKANTQK